MYISIRMSSETSIHIYVTNQIWLLLHGFTFLWWTETRFHTTLLIRHSNLMVTGFDKELMSVRCQCISLSSSKVCSIEHLKLRDPSPTKNKNEKHFKCHLQNGSNLVQASTWRTSFVLIVTLTTMLHVEVDYPVSVSGDRLVPIIRHIMFLEPCDIALFFDAGVCH